MKIRYGLVLALVVGLGFTGCASGGGGSDSGTIGGSGGALGGGESPRDTENTREAERHLDAGDESNDAAEAQMHYDAALTSAQAAIVEDPQNPLAHRLAAMAAMGAGDYGSAGAHFDHAVELRPLYEFDFMGIREQAWLDQYNEASPYVNSGDYETASVHFENANAIYQGRPEAFITLGQIYAQLRQHDRSLENIDAAIAFVESDAMADVDSATALGWREQAAEVPLLRAQVLADAGRFEEAVGAYREMSAADPTNVGIKSGLATILMQMGNEADAFVVYEELMAMPNLAAPDWFAIGVGFYQGSDYGRAADAFGGAASVSANDRDAIEMWARSLQLDSAFADVPPVAERWAALDPNSPNAYLILAQAANLNEDQTATQEAIQAVDALDFNVIDLQMRRFSDGGASISGSAINKKLADGASVSLRFTFYADDGSPMGSVTESVTLGGVDMAQVFQVQFDSAETVGGYGYEVTGG